MNTIPPDAPLLLQTDARGVATLTLNRPARGNAYTPQLLAQLVSLLTQVNHDPAVRVLLLRGSGKHFCVGADITPVDDESAAATSPATAATTVTAAVGLSDVCLALDTLSKPTVALVQGACVGGGVALIACCDVVVAERTSFYAIPEVRIGFAPGPVSPFFVRALGARQVRRLGLTGDRFAADEAWRLGLVHWLEDSVQVAAGLPALVDSLLLGAPGAQAEFKATLANIEHQAITADLLSELQQRFDHNKGASEAMEGRAAFSGKRKPSWYPAPSSN